jgi:hypothetical protein
LISPENTPLAQHGVGVADVAVVLLVEEADAVAVAVNDEDEEMMAGHRFKLVFKTTADWSGPNDDNPSSELTKPLNEL